MVFQLFKPFLKEKLRSRIVFMGHDKDLLYKYISPKCLPDCYGGTLCIPNVSGPQWLELLLTCDKEFMGVYDLIIIVFIYGFYAIRKIRLIENIEIKLNYVYQRY